MISNLCLNPSKQKLRSLLCVQEQNKKYSKTTPVELLMAHKDYIRLHPPAPLDQKTRLHQQSTH